MNDRPLKPATRDDFVQALSHGLRFEGRRRIHHADEIMGRIAAEKLADYLERSNFVVMRGPPAPDSAPALPTAKRDEA